MISPIGMPVFLKKMLGELAIKLEAVQRGWLSLASCQGGCRHLTPAKMTCWDLDGKKKQGRRV